MSKLFKIYSNKMKLFTAYNRHANSKITLRRIYLDRTQVVVIFDFNGYNHVMRLDIYNSIYSIYRMNGPNKRVYMQPNHFTESLLAYIPIYEYIEY